MEKQIVGRCLCCLVYIRVASVLLVSERIVGSRVSEIVDVADNSANLAYSWARTAVEGSLVMKTGSRYFLVVCCLCHMVGCAVYIRCLLEESGLYFENLVAESEYGCNCSAEGCSPCTWYPLEE